MAHTFFWLAGWWFQRFLEFSSLFGEMIQFDLRIFFRWVVQPPTRLVCLGGSWTVGSKQKYMLSCKP